MAVRSRRLCAYLGATVTGGTVVYTCPADRVAVVKDLTVWNASGAVSVVTVILRTGGSPFGVVRESLAVDARLTQLGRFLVLHEGDELRLAVSAGTTTGGIVASGALLAGDAA